jgi:oxygen-independent coproporphyrinogen-3 oxidase
MAGIYIHIPFCKQACHYCDFHFSTSLKKKPELIGAICKELILRKEAVSEPVETIYFGGGTPSLLTSEELAQIIDTCYAHFEIALEPEITLEANPDDLSEEKVAELAASAVNRLSIGIQSFFEEDLKFMNRAHTASEAMKSIELCRQHFENLSIDLIYGVPGLTDERWMKNLELSIAFNIPHLSCYALTVEPKTALAAFIQKGIVPPVDETAARTHYDLLIATTEAAGYDNYEFSNFGKAGFFSRNNTAYWAGKPYLGVGPSAHSYDGDTRSWNCRNNSKYIRVITAGELPLEREILSAADKYNEYIMTRLRTKWGVCLTTLTKDFGKEQREYLMQQAGKYLAEGLLILEQDRLKVTRKGKFLSDGIASDLFLLNLDSHAGNL